MDGIRDMTNGLKWILKNCEPKPDTQQEREKPSNQYDTQTAVVLLNNRMSL